MLKAKTESKEPLIISNLLVDFTAVVWQGDKSSKFELKDGTAFFVINKFIRKSDTKEHLSVGIVEQWTYKVSRPNEEEIEVNGADLYSHLRSLGYPVAPKPAPKIDIYK